MAAAVATVPVSGVAQKGMGDEEGVARQAEKPALQSMSGELLSIETHPCGQTTGHSPIGTHLRVRTQEQAEINLHLGPAADVGPMIEGLEPGQHVQFEAFRTPAMPESAFVAQRIRVGDKDVVFRVPGTLRPVWAGHYPGISFGRGWGMGMGRRTGPGTGQGKTPEPGAGSQPKGYGPCWW
jgi:hypothetical protein